MLGCRLRRARGCAWPSPYVGTRSPSSKNVKPEARVKQIRRVPNQKGVAEGQIKWHCSACMASLLHDGTADPDACPQGHQREATDEFTTG